LKSAVPIGSLFDKILRDLHIEKKVYQSQALGVWPKAVGPRIAAVTHPERVENGKLFVRVESPTWRMELILIKQKIIDRLNREIGSRVISDIIFK
jgi:predicted nucleic acid-binding Zn ribbon protein